MTIYAMPGSQFSAKVLVALDSRQIPHYVKFVDPQPSKRDLPSGGRMVPEMLHNGNAVPESDDILRYVDKLYNTAFFPASQPKVAEVCTRASTVLAAYIFYYNWVQEDSYRRSMAASMERYVPAFVCCFRQTAVDWLLSSTRDEFKDKVGAALNLDPENLPEAPEMLEKLVQELLFYQGLLENDSQPYIVPRTSQLTAADAALYTQIERLVGDEGDAKLPSALPSLRSEQRLTRLWRWHGEMRAKHPIRFKGKRAPEATE
eukprot:CAMPEP_0178406380 /NCGR_PEP_ID=MMETSP0689_2-20121128/18883_1 /TAXON_ID=160604 /ORGANISM="Amphidinium massartii, Strain CS-259" /LENGTH=259 /DNA_ID=CAMNT_0020027421 /DNA_START=16 /DNA_END=795 /DNA_ORIENTATION=+